MPNWKKTEKYFIKLINKHFPKQNILAKFFHKNNLKISNSYTKKHDPNY